MIPSGGAMTRVKMWCLTIKIKKNDEFQGKRLYNALLDFMMRAGISGATVVNAVDGFGRRGRSVLRIEGISMNYPLVIEAIEEPAKLEPLLPQLKRMVNDNGLVTIHEVYSL
jgi:PII-like signaling protein